ncbi:MAG: hypothetical protein ACQESP_12360, partial [Candidatus Muiribacteriota bacterium]
MLKNNLNDIAKIALLRSDKILIELLQSDGHGSVGRRSKAYENGVRDYYPNAFRKPAIENSMKKTLGEDAFTTEYGFDFLKELFEYYFVFDGNNIYAHKELLEKYSSLINKIHPFNIIGYKLAIDWKKGKLAPQNLKDYARYITPLALNTDRDFKEYADNHIHLGGSNT